MNLQGERIIPASVEKTWVSLNDPQTLKACIAGCESIETTGENQYLAVMAVRIGPVNAKFKGRLQLSDIVPLESYKINFDGQGGVAGFGKGSAAVRLSPSGTSGEATTLNYTADAQVGGKIAQIGSRLVESAAAKIADDFFKAFEARMTGAPGVAPAVATDDASGAAAGAAPGGATSDGAPGLTPNVAAGVTPGLAAGVTPGLAPGVAPGTTPDTTLRASSSIDPATAPAAVTADGMPQRPAPTLDHVVGRDMQSPVAPAGRGSTVWWIAGIIILVLLVYFFTR